MSTSESPKFDPFDPSEPIGPDKVPALQDHLLFTIFVCNKQADRTRQVLNQFYGGVTIKESPFNYVARLIRERKLDRRLKACRCGQYGRIGKALRQLIQKKLDVTTCTLDQLEEIHGIGQKSSRFFLMYGRGVRDVAVLDTHVLRWLHNCGVKDVPRGTPTSKKKYRELEQIFLRLCKEMGQEPNKLDFEVWKTGAELHRQKKGRTDS